MKRRTWMGRLVGGGLLASPLVVGCGGSMGALGGVAGASCPADVLSVSSIAQANFGLEAELEAKAKSALSAGALVYEIAAEMEAEVLTACKNIAQDLGVPEAEMRARDAKPGAEVEAVCGAAAKAIGAVRANVKGDFQLKIEPPVCYADANLMAECAGQCDANIEPGSAEVECEGGKLSGKCNGECQGTCRVEGAAECNGSCSGTCSGQCSGEMSGKCGGTCEGKCDGKNSSGRCDGTCEGRCDAQVEGSCDGECSGGCSATCEAKANGKCQGTCEGSCSVEFESPQCSGELKPPEMSAECQAKCEADVTAQLKCEPARVRASSTMEADTEQVKALFATLEANLPAILKVAGSMKGRAETVLESTQASLKGMQATLQGAGSDSMKVLGCFASSLDAQAKASAKISVSVEASASVSGSASGST